MDNQTNKEVKEMSIGKAIAILSIPIIIKVIIRRLIISTIRKDLKKGA